MLERGDVVEYIVPPGKRLECEHSIGICLEPLPYDPCHNQEAHGRDCTKWALAWIALRPDRPSEVSNRWHSGCLRKLFHIDLDAATAAQEGEKR